jgi:hypothetical protein
MMKKLFLALALCPALLLPCLAGPARPEVSRTCSPDNPPPAGWVVDRADNICGLDDAKMLSKPAKVDYDALLKATPQYKKIRDNKIDVNSPEGIQLRQEAANKVRDACDKIRQQDGYCSVWKSIRHTDSRVVADVTDLVKALL